MTLAIVADWLTVFGGAEHVVAEWHTLWPDAPLFTTVANRASLGPLSDADIRTTSLQRAYAWTGKHQLLLGHMPRAIESIDLSGFDTILSSSHAVAKGIVPPAHAVHVCYCHTPMRYAWQMEDEYLKDFRVPRFLHRCIKERLRILRRWDLQTAKRVDLFIANSTETQSRIRRIYNRDSIVLYPPVHDRFLQTPLITQSRQSYLALGRLVPYKRFDLLIELANKLSLPLSIAGTGQEEARLKAMAGPTVRFLGFVPDEKLPMLYQESKALLFPQHEDAGIVPLEAQASGTPVIAYGKGGALDTVQDGKTGIFFGEQTVDSLRDAIHRFESVAFNPEIVRAHAQQFSATHFRERMEDILEDARRTFVARKF